MLITPNNKLSNHCRKKKTEKHIWIDDQTVSSSFRQNMETMKEKTKTGMLYEHYLNPSVSFSDNFLPDFYSACSSMSSNDFNGSMMNPSANNNGIEGLNSFVGGDKQVLVNNHVDIGNGVFNELTDCQNTFGWTVMDTYNVDSETLTQEFTFKTTVSVFDAGRISSLTIGLSTGVSIPTLSWDGITYERLVMNIGSQTYTNIESGWNSFEFIKSVDGLTWALGQAIGFDAEVKVTDVGGEITTITLHRDGLFDKAWDFLTEIWSQFKDTVVSAAKAAWEAFNAILNWIKETVRFMFENVFKPVKNALDSLVNAGVDVFTRGWELYFAEDKPDDAARIIADWIFEVSAVFMAIWMVLFYLETLVKPFQPIVSGIVAVVGGIMLGVMLCYILPLIGLEGVPDVENVFITGDENSEDGISDSINENSPGSISKEMLYAALGMICSAYTYFLTVKYAGLFGTFVKGLTPTVMGVVFAFVSFLVSACSVVVSKTYPSLQEVCSVVSLFLAGTSLVAVVWGAAHGSMVYAPVCTILSLAFALSALLVSLYKMG